MKSDKIKIGSNKSFGIVFFVFFVLVSLYPLIYEKNINFYFLIVAFIFLFLGVVNSVLLTPLNLIWFKLGILLSKFFSPLIMSIIFFLVVTPISIIARIFKKDFLILDKTKNSNKNSYWTNKEKYKTTMKNQF